MTIQNNSVVSIHYTLKNKGGELLDSSTEGDPLIYLHGHQNIIPGLENALLGKNKGDKFSVSIDPENAYGERNEDLVQTLKKEQFESNENIEEGMRFQAETPTGNIMILTVKEVRDNEILVDGNHDLAGVQLNFDVEVKEIREATEEEITHGHVHQKGSCGCHGGNC